MKKLSAYSVWDVTESFKKKVVEESQDHCLCKNHTAVKEPSFLRMSLTFMATTCNHMALTLMPHSNVDVSGLQQARSAKYF